MSDESRRWNASDRNRDGLHDDIDRKPGNSEESESYARRYDPNAQKEYTNLGEAHHELQKTIQQEREEEMRLQTREAMHAAQQDVHFFPDVGKFIIPAQNSWAAHAELVQNNDMQLHFNPEAYFFDKIIADKLNLPALTDKDHPDFSKYKGLRTNLEVLRNDLIGMYLDDGGFDKGDEVYVPLLKGIAEVLGDALANDVWWKRPFLNYLSQDVANVEAVGAAEMYQFLLRQQDSVQALGGLRAGVREMFGVPQRNWGLLPLEESPFSPAGLSAPPPALEQMVPTPKIATEEQQALGERLALDGLALIQRTNAMFQGGAQLSAEDQRMSVDDGRIILRWLRNMQGMDLDAQDFLATGTPQDQQVKSERLQQLVTWYADAMQGNEHLHRDPVVKDGADAAGALAMMLAEHAMALLPEQSPARALLATAVDSMPEVQYERSTQSVARLLDHMESGLAKLTGELVGERSVEDRMAQAAIQLHQHAQELRSVERLSPPKREESVELGREILRKLRSMLASDKPVAEQLEAGSAADRAALAEQLAEIVEIYRNVIAEALTMDPGLAEDQRIKDANDAIGGMTHGIKLMASKDIPASHAQAQQISADVTQMPEQWKGLGARAVNRLLDTMEGALEAAVSAMDQAEQDQQRDEDLAQEAIEASLLQSGQNNKRRKRRAQKSGVGGKKARKVQLDLSRDDMAAGQGAYAAKQDSARGASSAKSSAGMSGKEETNALNLNMNDLAAIRSLGSKLKEAGRSAKFMPMAEASLLNGVSPDDKSAAERAIEKITSARRNQNRLGN